MTRARVAAALLATLLALAGSGGRFPVTATTAAELRHAVVVVDTSDGNVRKFCLAFPEESITGAEALRRIDSNAVFGSYGGQGQAVCALCGVGCPSGDCFCDGSKYWAYHRAGPGGAPYAYSRAGAGSTTVRDGDVEGWKWGTGDAPPAATVGEVCDVPEPPVRASSGVAATTTTSAAPAAPTASTQPGSAHDPDVAPAVDGPRSASPAGPAQAQAGRAAPVVPPPDAAGVGESAVPEAPAPTTTTGDALAAPGGAEGADPDERASSPGDAPGDGSGRGLSGAVGLAGFGAALAGVLGWRARLRRANVRRVTTLR